MGGGIELRARRNNGRGVYAPRKRGLRKKEWQHFGKSNPSMGHPDQGFTAGSKSRVDEDCGGGALFGADEVVFVFRKGQIAGLGAVRRREAFEHQGWVADNLAAQELRNFRNSKWH